MSLNEAAQELVEDSACSLGRYQAETYTNISDFLNNKLYCIYLQFHELEMHRRRRLAAQKPDPSPLVLR